MSVGLKGLSSQPSTEAAQVVHRRVGCVIGGGVKDAT